MALLGKLKFILHIEDDTPKIRYAIFKDKNSCIELFRCPRIRLQTKHIGLKYHHFRSKMKLGLVYVKYVNTIDQITDIFTKTFLEASFLKSRT